MIEEFAEAVANRIKELREAQGLSVRELGRRSEVAPEMISRSERMLTEISLTSLGKVMRGLGLTPREFFDFAQAQPTAPAGPEIKRAVTLLSRQAEGRANRLVRLMELVSNEWEEEAPPAETVPPAPTTDQPKATVKRTPTTKSGSRSKKR